MSVTNFIFKWTLRIIQPKEAKRMEQDGPIALPKLRGAMPADTEYVFIDDQGADTTVFAYSGMDALFAGRARYEFKRIFRSLSVPCNLVCFRDPRTTSFHLSLDGKSPGIDFYAEKTREIMAQLGATYNIALGSSSGGMSAFTFATMCNMDKVVGFSPAFPHTVYRGWNHYLQSLFNFRTLLREPQAYVEVLIVTIAVVWLEDVALKRMALDPPIGVWDAWGIYESAGDTRPPATVYYGVRSPADSRQALRLAEAFPDHIHLEPLDTARHNCPAVLLQQNKLIEVLDREVSAVAMSGKSNSEEGPLLP